MLRFRHSMKNVNEVEFFLLHILNSHPFVYPNGNVQEAINCNLKSPQSVSLEAEDNNFKMRTIR